MRRSYLVNRRTLIKPVAISSRSAWAARVSQCSAACRKSRFASASVAFWAFFSHSSALARNSAALLIERKPNRAVLVPVANAHAGQLMVDKIGALRASIKRKM